MYRNTLVRIAAALAAGLCLLFAQLTLAAYAGPTLLHAAVAETAPHARDYADGGHDPCVEQDTAHPELCMTYLNPAEVALQQARVDLPPVMLVALRPLADPWTSADLILLAPPPDLPLRSRPPPHAILHCCFRI